MMSVSPSLPSRSGPSPIRPSTRPSVYMIKDQAGPSSTSLLGQSRECEMPGGVHTGAWSSRTPPEVISRGCG